MATAPNARQIDDAIAPEANNIITFNDAFGRAMEHEGGFQAHPGDRGNWTSGKIGEGELRGTKFGISAMSYPDLDIANLTHEEAKAIYFRDWWEALRMDRIPGALAYQFFDAAINHGSHNAAKMLQRAVGATADGIIGPKTITAVSLRQASDLVLLFIAERLDFITALGGFPEFGRGWCRRQAQNLRFGAVDT